MHRKAAKIGRGMRRKEIKGGGIVHRQVGCTRRIRRQCGTGGEGANIGGMVYKGGRGGIDAMKAEAKSKKLGTYRCIYTGHA